MNYKLSLSLLVAAVFISCSVMKKINSTGIQEIYFGGGGGSTGRVVEYKLLRGGEIFLEEKQIATISKKRCLSYFKRQKNMPIMSTKIEEI